MKPSSETRVRPAGDAGGEKKPWSSPRLVVYGDLRRLTRTVKNSGKDNSTTTKNFSI